MNGTKSVGISVLMIVLVSLSFCQFPAAQNFVSVLVHFLVPEEFKEGHGGSLKAGSWGRCQGEAM